MLVSIKWMKNHHMRDPKKVSLQFPISHSILIEIGQKKDRPFLSVFFPSRYSNGIYLILLYCILQQQVVDLWFFVSSHLY